ncbi:MAG: restriction endonuclease [Deltaproteobacteria bacterium RBG_13_53_10]|nr:MAG: restriction endonuclease [Deltaproteobacteria bacterium RBG_13_53_10]
MAIELIPESIRTHFEIHEWKHACAVLKGDFKREWDDLIDVLGRFRLRASDVRAPGGGLSPVSQWFNKEFLDLGWQKKSFETKIVVDANEFESPTHEVDCFKSCVALEVEWSNKDPFFDRDLNNFRLLFDLRAISVGIIITKSDELSEIFQGMGKDIWNKYGWSTTWMKKLLPRIEGGGGGGCPILVFGITQKLYYANQ